MLFRGIYLKTLHDQWKLTFWVSIGLVAAALYTTLLFPTIRDASGLQGLVEDLPEFVRSIIGGATALTTPEGFLNTQPFSVLAPLMMVVYAVVRGAAAVAGEEESHTLDQLLANPVSRERLLVEKALAIETGLAVLSIVLYLAILSGVWMAGYSLDAWKLAQIVFSLFLLSSASCMLAAAIGAATGKRSLASGIVTGVLVAGWLLNALQQLAAVLEWTKYISVFWYYNSDSILVNGLIPWHAAVLAGITLIALAAGAARFRYRDLRG